MRKIEGHLLFLLINFVHPIKVRSMKHINLNVTWTRSYVNYVCFLVFKIENIWTTRRLVDGIPLILSDSNILRCGPGSSVGIATALRAGRSGIESLWGRHFPPVQTGPGAHPASCKMGTGSFPGVKCGQGVLLTTHPLLVPRS